MATTNNITTTYAGKRSGAFISTVLKAGATIGTPRVTLHNNVNLSMIINQLELSSLIKGATCDFDPTGTIDQTEVILAVKKLEVNLQLCKNDYYVDFVGENTGAWGPIADGAFLRYLTERIGGFVADANETMIWQGVDGADAFDGFETLMGADATVVDVITPVALTASNIGAELRRGTLVANPDILSKSDTYIYMGSQAYQVLQESNNDKGNANPCGENCISFDGIKTFRAPGMKPTTYVIASQSNLHSGSWVTSDLNRISVIDQEPLDGSDNVNYVMKYFGGVQIGIGAEIVLYAGV